MSEARWEVRLHPEPGEDRTVVVMRDRGYEYDYCPIGRLRSGRPKELARLLKRAQKEADRRNAAVDALAKALGRVSPDA